MEHDKRICPRCGQSAGDHGFCERCRAHIESLTGIPIHAGSHAAEVASPTTQVLHEVMRLEEALAAVSKGISERIAAGASTVEVDSDVRPSEKLPVDLSEGVLLPSTADERASDVAQRPREVARLEDVLTVSSPPPIAASVAPPTVPELEGAQLQSDGTTVEAQAAEAISVAPPVSTPMYVAAQALREAFWFEQASAFNGVPAARQVPTAVTESVAPPAATESTISDVAAQAVGNAEPAPRELDPPVAESNGWVTAIFLLTLVALVMLLTGRRPR